jgi:hypothetical protein
LTFMSIAIDRWVFTTKIYLFNLKKIKVIKPHLKQHMWHTLISWNFSFAILSRFN